MTHIYNNNQCCEGCSSNPVNNPLVSGICCCSLPYMSPTPLPPQHFTKPRDYEKYIQPYTITTTDSSSLIDYEEISRKATKRNGW